jgi:hypothetical protein
VDIEIGDNAGTTQSQRNAMLKVLKVLQRITNNGLYRLILLVAPGIGLGKLADYPGMPLALKSISSIVLAAGIIGFFSWEVIKRKMNPNQEIAPERAANREAPSGQHLGPIHVTLMRELVAMCSDDAKQALEYVANEIEVQPNLGYGTAIELAHRRRSVSGWRK